MGGGGGVTICETLGEKKWCPKRVLDLQEAELVLGLSLSNLGFLLSWSGQKAQVSTDRVGNPTTWGHHTFQDESWGQVTGGCGEAQAGARTMPRDLGIWAPAATCCESLRDSMWPGIMIPSSGNGCIYQAGWRRHQLST